MAIRLVVGLGNPGSRYVATRHNVGYRVIEALAPFDRAGVRLYKPEAVYMNDSGRPVAEMARRNGIAPQDVLVVCDDFSIPLGALRLRSKGSSGGQNGLKSILEHLGSQDVPRLRIGIGPVPEGMDPADYVLQNFSSEERPKVSDMVEKAAQAVRLVVEEGLQAAMNRFNTAPPVG